MFSPFTVLNRCIFLCLLLFVFIYSLLFLSEYFLYFSLIRGLPITATYLPSNSLQPSSLFSFSLMRPFFGDFEPTEKKVNVFVIIGVVKSGQFSKLVEISISGSRKNPICFSIKAKLRDLTAPLHLVFMNVRLSASLPIFSLPWLVNLQLRKKTFLCYVRRDVRKTDFQRANRVWRCPC